MDLQVVETPDSELFHRHILVFIDYPKNTSNYFNINNKYTLDLKYCS